MRKSWIELESHPSDTSSLPSLVAPSMRSLLISAFVVGAHATEKACNGLEVDKPTGTDK